MIALLVELQKKVAVALVGGSDLVKIQEQMGKDSNYFLWLPNNPFTTVTQRVKFVFSENGLVAHRDGKIVATQVCQISQMLITCFLEH